MLGKFPKDETMRKKLNETLEVSFWLFTTALISQWVKLSILEMGYEAVN
jgi:hypothetical protein